MNLAGFDINWIAMKAEIFSSTVTFKDDPFEDTDPRLVLRRNKYKRCYPVRRKFNRDPMAHTQESNLG